MLIFQKLFKHSVGKKAVVAATGLGLAFFLLGHMAGHLLMFAGPDAYNSYAYGLKTMGNVAGVPTLLWAARIGLLTIFVVHVVLAIQLTMANRAARPVRYAHENTVQASFASRYMILTGLLVLVFVVLHLAHFTLGLIEPKSFASMEQVTVNGAFVKRHDAYTMMVTDFRNPLYTGLYLVSMVILALHLRHGIKSLFQSFGTVRKQAYPLLEKISLGLMTLIVAGFCIVPIAIIANFIKLTGE